MSQKLDNAIHTAAAAASAPAASVPPATVAAATFMGYTPNEWLVWLSIAWILIQALAFIIDKVLRFRRDCKSRSGK